MSQIEEVWQRIEDVLKVHDAKRLEGLRGGASDEEIKALEQEIGAPLPEDFKESIRIHDGQIGTDAGILGGAWELVLSMGMIQVIKMYRGFTQDKKLADHFNGPGGYIKTKDSDKIRDIQWDVKWLPIGDNSGNLFLLDFNPGVKGTYGQVIEFDRVLGPVRVVAKSFTAWLENYAKRYEKRFLSK